MVCKNPKLEFSDLMIVLPGLRRTSRVKLPSKRLATWWLVLLVLLSAVLLGNTIKEYHHDKTRQPMKKSVMDGANMLMQIIADITDSWEKIEK